MCGYDTAYAGDRGVETDDAVLAIADNEGRTIVTRDQTLANRANESLLLEGLDLEDMLAELANTGIHLAPADPPTRCGRCNGPLSPESHPIDRPDYAPSDPRTPCWVCDRCHRVFWKGSHWDDVVTRLASIEEVA